MRLRCVARVVFVFFWRSGFGFCWDDLRAIRQNADVIDGRYYGWLNGKFQISNGLAMVKAGSLTVYPGSLSCLKCWKIRF